MGTESNWFESNSSSHNKIIVNSYIWQILAKFDYWQYLEFPKKNRIPPPQMWATLKLLQNVTFGTFGTFWRDFKNWARSAMIDVSKNFILMMGSYSQIYIKMNFQYPIFSIINFPLLSIFKEAKIASEIHRNAFWNAICS